MTNEAPTGRQWNSDVLLLAVVNGVAYLWSYWSSGWDVPHFGSYVCLPGAVISLVPVPRELLQSRFRAAALGGVAVSCLVIWHILATPCIGPCK
jgi:hypothetical protein